MKLATLVHYAGLERADRRAGRQLVCVQDRTDRIRPDDIILVTCLRDETFRMDVFAAHYRRLGVNHILAVDNGSTDGLRAWAAKQADVSVWYTEASYRASNFGMLWCNDLLRRFGCGRWCVCVDPDEFLVYPYMGTRSLRALTAFLDEEKRSAFHTLTLDAYSDRPLADTLLATGEDPFDVAPYFDRDGYFQCEGWGRGTWIRGGPRLRVYFRDCPEQAPALNKLPLVKWQRHFHYRMSMHDAWPFHLNRAHPPGDVAPTGALFHFKFVATLQTKAAEEADRGEHYAGGREYKRYREAGDTILYEPELSTHYRGPEQLVALGLMSPGHWF